MEGLIAGAAVAAAVVWIVYRQIARHRSRPPPGCSSCSGCPASGTGCSPTTLGAARKPTPREGGPRLPILAALLAAGLAVPAQAADTVETWDPGAADVEFSLGYDGLGGERLGHAVYGDLLVGYGVAERVSAYLGTTLQANGYLAEAAPGLRLGVFSTVVDRPLFDLDLMLEIGAGGEGLREMQLAPGAELNLDLRSPLGPVGLYLGVGLPLGGRARDGGPGYETLWQLDLSPGLYWIVHEGHQLLVEYHAAVVPASAGEPWRWESSALALGYNVVLSPALELITELAVGRAEGGGLAAGLMAGFIATIPGAGR